MIVPFLLFSALLFFSVIFDILLLIIVILYGDKKRIPVVYIYNLLICNAIDNIILFIGYYMPMIWEDDFYLEFRRVTGPVLTIFCTFFYEHSLYLNPLMIVQRIYGVYDPTSNLFSDKKLWIYSAILAIVSLISLLIPFFSECQINMNQRLLTFESACAPNRHTITTLQNRYLFLIPVFSMLLNIALILFLSIKHGELLHNLDNTHTSE
ncbi:unnamed protein product [Caenorhabditis bovis]|uniref:G-protein coupled receptors family 1 profile domain-containing protein n=1 Tax=Caenorhabditis bovis TaxID=2654633 RepID=A0A8S1DZY1_9PELO|nr:unnamed protein product [Caenorhabditis bovis]